MSAVVAFANQKGGVAKTTTVQTLGDALSRSGVKVLLIDLDPQACLTYAFGIDADNLESSLHDVFVGRASAADVVISNPEGPALLPSSIDLSGAEVHLLTQTGREYVLARALEPLSNDYDLMLIDCGPSLGVLTINALTAADHLIIPFQSDTLSSRGIGQLLETVADVRAFTNPDLNILGAVATMFDGRTRLAQEVLAAVSVQHGVEVFDPPIPKSVRVAEAPGRGVSVLSHAPRSKPAEAYVELAANVAKAIGIRP